MRRWSLRPQARPLPDGTTFPHSSHQRMGFQGEGTSFPLVFFPLFLQRNRAPPGRAPFPPVPTAMKAMKKPPSNLQRHLPVPLILRLQQRPGGRQTAGPVAGLVHQAGLSQRGGVVHLVGFLQGHHLDPLGGPGGFHRNAVGLEEESPALGGVEDHVLLLPRRKGQHVL